MHLHVPFRYSPASHFVEGFHPPHLSKRFILPPPMQRVATIYLGAVPRPFLFSPHFESSLFLPRHCLRVPPPFPFDNPAGGSSIIPSRCLFFFLQGSRRFQSPFTSLVFNSAHVFQIWFLSEVFPLCSPLTLVIGKEENVLSVPQL